MLQGDAKFFLNHRYFFIRLRQFRKILGEKRERKADFNTCFSNHFVTICSAWQNSIQRILRIDCSRL